MTESALQTNIQEGASAQQIPRTVVDMFEDQVRQHPQKVALHIAGEKWTYAELNGRANWFARYLLRVLPGSPSAIGLLITAKPVDLLIAMMAVLKTGHFYVQLSDTTPIAGLQTMIEELECSFIITDQPSRTLVSSLGDVQFIDASMIGSDSQAENLGIEIHPHQIGSVQYTSGSTGQPKGAIKTHQQKARTLTHHKNDLHRVDTLRLSLLPVTSGYGVAQSFGNIVIGAPCVLIDPTTYSYAQVTDLVLAWDPTSIVGVPSHIRHWISTIPDGVVFDSVRKVSMGSEVVTASDLEIIRRCFRKDTLVTISLGMSEVGIVAQYTDRLWRERKRNRVPVGRPIGDLEISIVDNNLQPLTTGKPGEIVVVGDFRGMGYWKRPEWNTEKFLPVLGDEHRSMYRTGDIGRMDKQGNLIILGRNDDQIKIRGHRINTNIIEAELMQHPSISEAVVMVRYTSNQEKKFLVAYLVCEDDLYVQDIRRFLEKSLQPEAIPAHYYRVDEIPRLRSMKINQRVLAQQNNHPLLFTSTPRDHPQNFVEFLLEYWCRKIFALDNRTRFAMNEPFLDAGGDSFAANELVLHIEKQFGVELQPAFFGQNPTLRKTAEIIQTMHGEPIKPPTFVPLSEGKEGAKTCILLPPTGGSGISVLWAHSLINPDDHLVALHPRGFEPDEEPLTTIPEMAKAYCEAFIREDFHQPYLVCICGGVFVGMELARLYAEATGVFLPVMMFDMYTPVIGPTWRPKTWVGQATPEDYEFHAIRAVTDRELLFTSRMYGRPYVPHTVAERTFEAQVYEGQGLLILSEQFDQSLLPAHDGPDADKYERWRTIFPNDLQIAVIPDTQHLSYLFDDTLREDVKAIIATFVDAQFPADSESSGEGHSSF